MWAVLPIKDFSQVKQRLSGVLTPTERRHLFHAMVQDALDVLTVQPELERCVLVSDDPAAGLLAEHYGALCWREQELGAAGLNAVATAAATRIAAAGADSMMIVHGDLPLLQAGELRELVACHRAASGERAVTLATDRHGDGSNIVLCRPPTALEFAYGPGSCRRHRLNAERAGAAFDVLQLPGASRDIDSSDDLFDLLDVQWHDRALHTMNYLRESGIVHRLRAMAAGGANTDYPERDAE